MIENNIPPPLDRRQPGNLTYPWAKMNIGDSIVVNADHITRARGAANQFKKYHRDWNYVTRLQPDGSLRIWRIAPDD
jgi:hypothetical protein